MISIIVFPTCMLIFSLVVVRMNFYNNLSDFYKLVAALPIISSFVIVQWATVGRKFKRFKAFEHTKTQILHRDFNNFLQVYKNVNYEFRVNIMLVKRRLLCKYEPQEKNRDKTKISFLPKVFNVVWSSPNMDFHPDKAIQFTTNQAVCGESYRTGNIKLADLTVDNPEGYNLNNRQLAATKNVKVILSCPIWEMDFDTLRPSSKKIGVVNIDSKCEGVEEFMKNQDNMQYMAEKIQTWSKLCSLLY